MTQAADAPTARIPNPRGEGERLRVDLVLAARHLLTEAPEAAPFSLRAVAKRVGVAPSAVYRHFASVDELVHAVLVDGNAELREALELPDGPLDRRQLIALGHRYLHWGLANPGAYGVLFESADRLAHIAGPGAPGWDMIEQLTRGLEASHGADAPVVAIRLWTSLHGLTSLRVHKGDDPWPTSAEHEIEVLVDALLLTR
ncbi:TetR/AcrR family transcriptional regulator [Protaetiibacter mangrovi]|uniref:WHG domain-containing protein n=1 Tax=Protaetiibacter mangrovi TaxID=2970926 RepID=A0ABT1ZDT5_9MICO|nr:TetR/AcrR family transcriptional regulator [Protaetiibacter mangrovi]MCS0498841.1 WHG domain-containing protein [Protaetiibacter mangrovi]